MAEMQQKYDPHYWQVLYVLIDDRESVRDERVALLRTRRPDSRLIVFFRVANGEQNVLLSVYRADYRVVGCLTSDE